MSAAIERSRQRREVEVKRMEEEKRAAAKETLQRLEEKLAKKDPDDKVGLWKGFNYIWAHCSLLCLCLGNIFNQIGTQIKHTYM